MNYKDYFKGKKITQMGLGLLGRGVGDAAFLAECGADLIVTDMKSAEELAPSLEKLKKYPNIKFKLGGHDLEDFKGRDFILKAAGVPLDSIYIAEAKKNNIPIEMDASLFCKLAPVGVITIGITGTRGKSTVAHLCSDILKNVRMTYLAGNVRNTATLPLLKEVKAGDAVVLELDSWQMQGFGESKISPHIAVFTNLMEDHKNYYKAHPEQYFKDKANIFKFQNENDFLIVGERVAEKIKAENPCLAGRQAKGKIIVAEKQNVPKDWQIKLLGQHNMENIACAIEAARSLGISEEDIKKGVESFGGVEGRLQFVREINGVKIYNDNNATTPEATVAALKALNPKSEIPNIILICGGADKGLELEGLIQEINKCKAVIMLPGSGSDRLKINATKVDNLKEAVDKALESATHGDTILFSPAFASFGPLPGGFKNEYDRNDQFLEIIKNLK